MEDPETKPEETEEQDEQEETQPIGNCPHCKRPVYTDVGYCGGCRSNW